MHTKDKGNISETKVLARLTELEYTVSVPYGDNAPYDFVVDGGDEIARVQVKTANYKNGCVEVETRSTNSNTNEVWTETYEGKVDWFAAYSPEQDECYAFPIENAGSRKKTLRVEEPDVSNPNINWAEDYVLDEDTPI